MAEKIKSFDVDIAQERGTFESFFPKIKKSKEFDFEGLTIVRKLLSNEKTRLLNSIKLNKPKSVYELAKLLGRDFKAVVEDLKVLQKFGFVDLILEKTGKRKRLKPLLLVDKVQINVKI